MDNFLKGKSAFVAIIALVVLVYFRSLFFGFVYLDDNYLILTNIPFISKLSNILTAFQSDVFYKQWGTYYRPILTLSFMLDVQYSGSNSWGYHVTNVLIHIVNCCLIFSLLKKLNYSKDAAFYFTLIFSIHPILTQAVSWIPGRNDSMLALFLLSSFYFFIRFLDERKWKWLVFYFLMFLLGTFTKEPSILFPIVCLIFISIYSPKKLQVSEWIILFAGWILIPSFWIVMKKFALKIETTTMMEALNPFANIFKGILSYAGNTFLPLSLSVFPHPRDINIVYGAVALILVFIFFLKGVAAPKRLMFGLCWYCIFLFPGIFFNYVEVPNFLYHRTYLSMFGLLMVVMESNLLKNFSLSKKKHSVIASIILIALIVRTIFFSENFYDSKKFWTNVIHTSPHVYRAYNQLGSMYLEENNLEEAEKLFYKSLTMKSDFVEAITNLGIVAYQRNNYQMAGNLFHKAINIDPNFTKAYFNLGLNNRKEGKLDSALINYYTAIEHYNNVPDPSIRDFLPTTWTLIGNIYRMKNNYEQAIPAYKKAIEANPEFAQPYKEIAVVYQSMGDMQTANYYLQKANALQ